MYKKPVIALLIIIFINIMLLGYSMLYSYTDNLWVKKNIRFLTLAKIFSFTDDETNVAADSLLQAYLSNTVSNDSILRRDNISKIGPKKQNIFLYNPEVGDERALDNFFEHILLKKDSLVIRIAHYGDSQLEGDRMSYVIRQKMHKKFGGSGIGYVPMKDLAPVSYIRKNSRNWKRYTVFHDKYNTNFYGLSGTVCLFTKYAVMQEEESDSLKTNIPETEPAENDVAVYYNAHVIVKAGTKYSYNNISFLYGNTDEKCVVNFYDNNNGTKITTDTLTPSRGVCMHKTNIGNVLNIKIEFLADQSPDFYGMYFDSYHGVQVDNYAIRGHSGDGLLMIDDNHLAKMLQITNTKLIIFQYGANAVPYIRSEKVCDAIGDIYYKLFMKFKKAAPDISILVIGAGDMASGGDGGYTSYRWLPKINEMQKNAAFKAGCAYWDLFNMMGGANSILVWTKRNLAVTNGHFSAQGQEIVANEIVEALMIEYNNYIHQKKNKNLN
ncbi:MAG: hypothetical protein PHR81_09720 [Bacteroidales bacterium]|jgi:lysophospholipase L1-like esterase|nr:hypothetical protein [Bacteroidales bacterium]MDD4215077.1 hypothetical protein [Bacteroidales bacterium]